MIITEKSSYKLLKKKVEDIKNSIAVGGKTPTGSGSTSSTRNTSTPGVSVTTEAIHTANKEVKETEEVGFIFKVYPKTDKVFVKVNKEEPDENGNPRFFNNHFSAPQDSLEAQMLLPLVNFDPTTGESLDNIVGKKVMVKVNKDGIAYEARRVFATVDDTLLNKNISPLDFYYASRHPTLSLEEALKQMGYDEQTVELWKNIGREESEGEGYENPKDEPGVVRIEGEAYWDQTIEEDTERTERFKKAVDEWTERNFSKMKTKLCHNPIIAFSAR